jgi:predicted permease
MDLLVAALPSLPFGLTVSLDFGVDWRVLCFTAAVSVGAGLVFGMLPAFGATGVDLASVLKTDSTAGGFGVKRSRLRNSLVVAQVAVSLVLLIVAGLFVRSLSSARAVDPGFEHQNVLAVMLDVGALDYDEARCAGFHEQLLERVRALPNVESASIDDCPPLTIAISKTNFWIEGYRNPETEDGRVDVGFSTTSTDNFKTLRIPILLGRDFSERDTAAASRVAIVNRAFVKHFWPGQNPIGKHISREGPDGDLWEVVGVTATVKHWLIGEEPRPYIYLPLSQRPYQPLSMLLARTTGDPMTLAAPVRAILREIDSNLAPSDTSRLTDKISVMLLPDKFAAVGFGLFGVLALVLASVGLYGVMAYAVSQRTREIGIRATLGAQRGDILRLTMKQGVVLTAIGVAIGLGIALASTRVLSALLYDVGATDPLTFVAVPLLLLMVALLACYVPARRATKVDPVVALRCE